MADILLNKIINNEVECDLFLSWLAHSNRDDTNFIEINKNNCSRTDFISYFLNFLHEEVPCNNVGKTPQKLNTPKRIEIKNTVEGNEGIIKRRQSLFTIKNVDNKNDLNKSSSVPLNLNKTIQNLSNLSSTPKITRQEDQSNVIETSYLSPISPLYQNKNFTTPKYKKLPTPLKSSEKASPICLGDFIVTKKAHKKKAFRSLNLDDGSEARTKRITPTSLSNKKINSKFRETENSFNFQNTYEEIETDNVKSQRNFLAEERIKILTRKNSGESLAISVKKITNFKVESEPDINLVTYSDKIEIVVKIYVYLLNRYWVLNVTNVKEDVGVNSSCEIVGVDFLKKDGDQSVFNYNCSEIKRLYNSEIFENVHNVVYFAAKSLESLKDILKNYDKSTLKLLGDNKTLKAFSPNFCDEIKRISETKPERIIEITGNDTQTNVCFNIDTDNIENFPNSNSFHSFRKQRDLFYEILRIWENNHLQSGWCYQISLSGKIKSLLTLSSDPVNFVHFSRLFKAQLLSTCGKLQNEEGLSENQIPFLASLPNLDADKLNRLKSRLVTKQSSNGLNALPGFPEHQEFYKEFIITASNHTFNKHLNDSLVSEILELNNSKFDGIDTDADRNTRQSYLTCVKSLRVLAKFLGFIESLPYKSEAQNFSERILSVQLKVRQQTHPSFDIQDILKTSIKEEKVILIIPWITEYLAMLDHATLRLPYYLELYRNLFDLYKNFASKSDLNKSLVKISLGWLFEFSHFPDGEFFKQIGDEPMIRDVSRFVPTDELDLVDQNILYVCCPYLREVKMLLTSNASVASGVTVKHITPVTAVQSSNEIAHKKLEHQLEEAFFNGQPVSVRKTVEFVSERVASTCVKHICNAVVPNFKKIALEELKTLTESWKKNTVGMTDSKKNNERSALRVKVNHLAQKSYRNLKKSCEKESISIAKEKIPASIDSLLALDCLKATQNTCAAISVRLCVERVDQWINAHVSTAIFLKDFDAEMQKAFFEKESPKAAKDKPVFLLPPGGSRSNHNDSTLSAAHLLEKLKIFSINIIEQTITVTDDLLLGILNESFATLTERGDVNESITAYICILMVDISLLLVAHHSRVLLKEPVLSKFLTIWRLYYGNTDNLFANLISSRNIMLLAQSNNVDQAWQTFAKLVAFLVKEKLLDGDNFEGQCTAIFRNDWDEGTLKNLSTFLKTFVASYKDCGGSTDKFTLLLQFLSEFCVDL